jgi:hypothetical protein
MIPTLIHPLVLSTLDYIFKQFKGKNHLAISLANQFFTRFLDLPSAGDPGGGLEFLFLPPNVTAPGSFSAIYPGDPAGFSLHSRSIDDVSTGNEFDI